MSNTEKRAELLTLWEMGWKLGLAFGGKDKFGLEHAKFDVLMGPQIAISSGRQKWKPDAREVPRPERKLWDSDWTQRG